MTDIVEFLRDRLDEDERVALGAVRWNEGCTDWADAGEPDWEHIARHDPARVLREVQAKRAIVDDHSPATEFGEYLRDGRGNVLLHCSSCGTTDEYPVEVPCPTLRHLAAVYSDHPDYRQEWSVAALGA